MYLLVLGALAAVPLPTYPKELATRAWYDVNGTIEAACSTDARGGVLCDEDLLMDAIRAAETFQTHLFREPRLEYLEGLAWNLRGVPREAEAHFTASVDLDPNRQDAWHDLGVLLTSQGRYDEAEEAFLRVQELVSDGPQSWIGPWRLMEVAAHQGDAEAFELHAREALRRGFSFRHIAGLPNWQGFYADPRMRDSIKKMISVYSDPDVLDTLESPPEPTP